MNDPVDGGQFCGEMIVPQITHQQFDPRVIEAQPSASKVRAARVGSHRNTRKPTGDVLTDATTCAGDQDATQATAPRRSITFFAGAEEGSSVFFRVPGRTRPQVEDVMTACLAHAVSMRLRSLPVFEQQSGVHVALNTDVFRQFASVAMSTVQSRMMSTPVVAIRSMTPALPEMYRMNGVSGWVCLTRSTTFF